MTRHERVRLMDHVNKLRDRLLKEPIDQLSSLHRLQGEAKPERLPPSTLGSVVRFLADHRDREQFERFLQLLPAMDVWTGQNANKPRAYNLVLSKILLEWLRDYPDLTADQCYYVLCWVRRQLPSKKLELPLGEATSQITASDLKVLRSAQNAPPRPKTRIDSSSSSPAPGLDLSSTGASSSGELTAVQQAWLKAQEKARKKKNKKKDS
ncbi:MAG: hypothetical protein AAGC60_06130 [Acidobacteriota bacterium]